MTLTRCVVSPLSPPLSGGYSLEEPGERLEGVQRDLPAGAPAERRYPILVAFLYQALVEVTDEVIEMFDRCLADADARAEKDVQEFRLPMARATWARLAAGGGLAVTLVREQAPFQRNRVRRGEDDCVYLGYPIVLVRTQGSSGFVVPLFVQPMRANWSAGMPNLAPDGPIAVNGAWLEYRLRQRAEREAFLRAMGFLNDYSEDEDDSERPVSGPKDFARLAQNAAHYVFDPQHFAEHIEPLALSRVPDWAKAEPGLYNLPVLMLGPRLRYTRSLLRDLHDIVKKFSDEDLDGTALAQLFAYERPATPDRGQVIQGGGLAAPKLDAGGRAPAGSPVEVAATVESKPTAQAFAAEHLAQTRLIHPSQRAAVVNAMAEPVFIVTGPPGTGKSEVVAAMLLNQLLRGRPTLFASKNH